MNPATNSEKLKFLQDRYKDLESCDRIYFTWGRDLRSLAQVSKRRPKVTTKNII